MPTLIRWRPALLAVVAVSSSALTACGGGSGDAARIRPGDRIPISRGYEGNEPALAHVHGLGRNPADGAIYIATHFGLWRMKKGEDPVRVGDYLHDFMGFAVVGPDRFIASGHPNGARDLPPHMGLIESTDAGRTWNSRSLFGTADFHTLIAAGEGAVGWSSNTGELQFSDDLKTWDTRAKQLALADFAADPATRTTVVISITRSETRLQLRRSDDGGRTFTTIRKAPQLARFAWSDPKRLWGFATDGVVWRSGDGGRTWARAGSLGAPPEAVADEDGMLLAAAGGAIQRSTDGGRSWDRLYTYDD